MKPARRTDEAASIEEQARAVRPRLDDPKYLENGSVNPGYEEWLLIPWAEKHPLSEYLHDHDHPVIDGDGYFDRKKIEKALGKRGPNYWLTGLQPLPLKSKLPILADLIGVPLDDLTVVYETDIKMREEHSRIMWACRSLPCRLLSYEQMTSGVACPGCGVPWVGDRSADDDERFVRQHGECDAGRHSLGGGATHCPRCCGYPPLSPEQEQYFQDFLEELRRTEQKPVPTPEEERERKRVRRAERITELERTLTRLRTEEAADTPSL